MDTDETGAVWFGCQHEGPATERPALVGRAVRGKELELIDMPEDVLSGFRNYIGSVAANRDAGTVAVTSPQGNSFAVIEAASGKVVAIERLTEVCGVAPDHDGLHGDDGHGRRSSSRTASLQKTQSYVWDNHVLRVEA